MATFRIDQGFIADHNRIGEPDPATDSAHLGAQLARRGIDIEAVTAAAQAFAVAMPTWGVGRGGTPFGRFPGPGELRGIEEKLEDCATIQQLVRKLSYKFGSITHTDPAVARLIEAKKLAGLHFDDSKYGDDDLDSGSIDPFRLFLVFHELVDAEAEGRPSSAPAPMMDQSHNVTDPIESLIASAAALQRAHAQALLVDRVALAGDQKANDALIALATTLRRAFAIDVKPVLATARLRAGGAIDPIGVYGASGYRAHKGAERPQIAKLGGGIV